MLGNVFSLLLTVLLLLLSRFSRVRLCDPIDGSSPGSPSLGFSREEHWSGLPFLSPMHESEKWTWSRSVMSDSSRPHRLQPARLLCPWDFPGQSTGVGYHCLLHCWLYVQLKLGCVCMWKLCSYRIREGLILGDSEKALPHWRKGLEKKDGIQTWGRTDWERFFFSWKWRKSGFLLFVLQCSVMKPW